MCIASEAVKISIFDFPFITQAIDPYCSPRPGFSLEKMEFVH